MNVIRSTSSGFGDFCVDWGHAQCALHCTAEPRDQQTPQQLLTCREQNSRSSGATSHIHAKTPVMFKEANSSLFVDPKQIPPCLPRRCQIGMQGHHMQIYDFCHLLMS